MGVEIEKKYRLTSEQSARFPELLRSIGARLEGEEFEVNTLYAGNNLNTETCVLRLRRTERRGVLTYKERGASASDIKARREEETEVTDADATHEILVALGYRPSLVYEKRRATWHAGDVEIVLDELPFGLFAEIEGAEASIRRLESSLGIAGAEGVAETYPDLAARYGTTRDGITEARFDQT